VTLINSTGKLWSHSATNEQMLSNYRGLWSTDCALGEEMCGDVAAQILEESKLSVAE